MRTNLASVNLSLVEQSLRFAIHQIMFIRIGIDILFSIIKLLIVILVYLIISISIIETPLKVDDEIRLLEFV